MHCTLLHHEKVLFCQLDKFSIENTVATFKYVDLFHIPLNWYFLPVNHVIYFVGAMYINLKNILDVAK